MDYSRFRFVFVVDWIELEVRLLKATQGQHLKKAGAGMFSHVHGINPQTGEKYPENRKGTTTTRFAVRIQATERFATIKAALDAIRCRLDPSSTIAVLGIEVALDAYAKNGTANELAEMAAHFLKGINRVSPEHPRIYRLKNEKRDIGSHRELIQALKEGFQIGIGNGNGTRFQHGYLKTTDNGQTLPECQHRARIEIRLQGEGCPVQTLDALADFNFGDLSNYFRFRQFGAPQNEFERLAADRQICLGNILDDQGGLIAINRKEGGTRLNKRGTKSSPLNDIARSAIRNLSRRWINSAPGGRRIVMTCGNTGNLTSPETDSDAATTATADEPKCFAQSKHSGIPRNDEAMENKAEENHALNTDYPPIPTQLTGPIKVVCGITPYADLLPILHDLHQSPYPPLPDMTVETADI